MGISQAQRDDLFYFYWIDEAIREGFLNYLHIVPGDSYYDTRLSPVNKEPEIRCIFFVSRKGGCSLYPPTLYGKTLISIYKEIYELTHKDFIKYKEALKNDE